MTRGQERAAIFRDPKDYQGFLHRLGKELLATKTTCVAWSLMPNHVHLVLFTGALPLTTLMRRVLTGYAIGFNRRWRRSGYVFQGRYKSLLCERDAYLLELVRYVHLNPVRAHLCDGLDGLKRYPWTGHRRLLGDDKPIWQDPTPILDEFSSDARTARLSYLQFCEDGLQDPPDVRLIGEGLKHLMEGGWETASGSGHRPKEVATERLLGSDMFADRILKEADDQERWRSRARREGVSLERLMRYSAQRFKFSWAAWRAKAGTHARANARAVACHWAVNRLGCTEVAVARYLGITQGAVSKAAIKGEAIAERQQLNLDLEAIGAK